MPPRLQPLPPDEWDDLLKAVVSRSPGGAEKPLNIFTTLGRHPELFRRWLGFGGALLDGKLEARQRELVILRTAHHCSSEYEWVQHVPLARAVGIDDEEIESLRGALDAHAWNDSDRVVLKAADELHDKFSLSDDTWEDLSSRLDDATLIELVMLVGQYHLVALTVSALQIQVEGP
jgi:alkylhydroperoxidase family enzyme